MRSTGSIVRLVDLANRAFVAAAERHRGPDLAWLHPLCSGLSPSSPRTTSWPSSRNSPATGTGWLTAANGLNVLPLGAAALAGTSLPIDRDHVARSPSGSTRVTANSLDTSSDRDFALESAFVLTVIAEHLSGWAEEWVIWSTQEFSFLKLARRALHRVSSIMPQKKNPDVLELIRGRTARVVGVPDDALGPDQRFAARLQSRPPGGQGAVVRRLRHGGPPALTSPPIVVDGATLRADRIVEPPRRGVTSTPQR